MVEWETARELALSFPEVEEETTGRARFRVRGKAFAWIARERDGGGLAVRVDRDEKQLILDANPDAYFTARTTTATQRFRCAWSRSTSTSSASDSRTRG